MDVLSGKNNTEKNIKNQVITKIAWTILVSLIVLLILFGSYTYWLLFEEIRGVTVANSRLLSSLIFITFGLTYLSILMMYILSSEEKNKQYVSILGMISIFLLCISGLLLVFFIMTIFSYLFFPFVTIIGIVIIGYFLLSFYTIILFCIIVIKPVVMFMRGKK